MTGLSEKVFLYVDAPTEDIPVSDQQRLQTALQDLGYENIRIPLAILQKLYPTCRLEAGVTVTLVFREGAAVVWQIEQGDTTAQHYGRAVDYGSTTVHMQLVDLCSGAIIGLEKAENGQIAYEKDILTRITYSLEDPSYTDMNRFPTIRDRLAERRWYYDISRILSYVGEVDRFSEGEAYQCCPSYRCKKRQHPSKWLDGVPRTAADPVRIASGLYLLR